MFVAIAVCACVATFVGLRTAVVFLPVHYASAVETGFLASLAVSMLMIKMPFTLFFLSELKASREITGAIVGALFMIAAVSVVGQLQPNEGMVIRLLGNGLQAAILALFFLFDWGKSPKTPPE